MVTIKFNELPKANDWFDKKEPLEAFLQAMVFLVNRHGPVTLTSADLDYASSLCPVISKEGNGIWVLSVKKESLP